MPMSRDFFALKVNILSLVLLNETLSQDAQIPHIRSVFRSELHL